MLDIPDVEPTLRKLELKLKGGYLAEDYEINISSK